MPESGYTNCACRDCFDIVVSSDTAHPDLCDDCEEAGCNRTGASECERPNYGDTYGDAEEEED